MAENVIPRIQALDYDPDWGELFTSAFRTENLVGSAVQRIKNYRMFGDADTTPVNDADINTAVSASGLDPFIARFTDVETRGDLNNKIAHVKQQAEDRAILDKGGWSGFGAQMFAGVADLPTLVPFGHAARLGRLGTETLKTTASKLAITSALDAGTTEAGLQLTQDLRTPEESVMAVGGGMLLTTMLGTGAARWLSKGHHADLSARMENELPKLADGRAEVEVAHQFDQASANTARVINGERPEPQLPWKDAVAGQRARDFLAENGVSPRNKLDDFPDNTQRAALIGADGKLYDLNEKFGTHASWMKAVDDLADPHLSDDMSNILQLSVYKENGVVSLATGSQSPLTTKQLRGVRAAAKSYGIDARDIHFREDKSGGVEIVAGIKDPKDQGYTNLSRYQSANARKGAAEKAGTPPEDPELRQGLPSTRWDGEAKADLNPVPKQFREAAPRGPAGVRDDTGAWFLDGDKLVYANGRRESLNQLFGPDYASRFDDYPSISGSSPYGGPFTVWYKDTPSGKEAAERLAEFYRSNDAITTPGQDFHRSQGLLLGYQPEKVDGYITHRFAPGGDLSGAPPGSPPAGGKGGGGEPPSGGQTPPGGPQLALPGPFDPLMSPSQMAFANSGGAIAATRGLTRLFGGSPILEMMNSTSTGARAWIMRVAELSGRTKGAYDGIANPIAIQSRMTEYEGMRAVMTRDFYSAYKGWKQGFDIRGKEFERFSRNVSQALVRNTFDDPSLDPNVAKAAKAIRNTISEMYARAVEQGLIRKDAWKPGDKKNPFTSFDDIRSKADDTTFDPKDSVDQFLQTIADAAAKGEGNGRASRKSAGATNKITNENANVSQLTAKDAELFGQIARDVEAGGAALADSSTNVGFFKETGSRLTRGGQSGERGLDYNVGLKFERGPNGELGDSLVQSGGLINRRYTDRVSHEREAFMRAETMAELQDKDVQIRNARAFNEEQIKKAREDAIAKGEDPDIAAKQVKLDKNANAKLWHELNNAQLKRSRMMSAMNHAKGSWEFIVHGTVKSGDAKALRMEAAGVRSPLHRRNVKLSDEVLLAKGWIDDDALGIANHTVRQIASDVELAKVFRRPMENFTAETHGFSKNEMNDAEFLKPDAYWVDGKDPTTVPDLGMKGPREVIGKEFDDMFAKIPDGVEHDAARNRLITERARILGGTDANGRTVQGYLDVVTDMIRGNHKVAENATPTALNLQAAKSYIFAARMGANVITNIGDVGAVIMRHGLGNLMHNYAVRSADLVKSLADPEALATLATKWELPQDRVGAILAREARAAGIAVETDLMSRMASQMDLMDPFRNAKAKDTAFQQTADWLARAGSKAYLINAWTNGIRKAAYGIYVDRVIRMAMEPGNIGKHERVWLADLGIDDKMLARINREVTDNQGAVLDGGVWHMQHENWQDLGLRSDFWATARKDVNNANVSPTALEKPLAFTNPIVNTMLQFWSFSFGATMRIMGQSSQRVINGTDGMASDGTRTLLGVGAMVGLGMGTYALHNYASTWRQRQNGTLDPRDELPDFQDNWRQWLLQGTTRSGVFGVFSQMGDVMDNLGVNPVYKGIRSFDENPDQSDPIKKYGRPNAVKNVMGPSAGLLDDLISAGRGIAYGSIYQDEDIKRSNVRAITRNLPFVNSFYLKSLTKEGVEYLNDEVLQLPPDRR